MKENSENSIETQVVVFDLASEYYGVEIGAVREIIRLQSVTRIPCTPSFVEGIINLRGQVIPVVDLRKRLGLMVNDHTDESRIVWVNINGYDVGVIVDAVIEVLRIPAGVIEPRISIMGRGHSDYLKGVAKMANRLIILLDIGAALGSLSLMQETVPVI